MHKFMTFILGAILGLAGIAGSADAANFTDTSFGISIDIDDALPKQPLVRDIQPFVSQDNLVSLVIRRAYDLSIIDFVDELRHVGYRDGRHQVSLRISGEPFEAKIESGRGLLIPVQGQVGGQPLNGIIGAYSGHSGHGFLIIGTARTDYWPTWKQRMQAMFESVKFVEVDTNAMVEQWQDRLKGKKLQYQQANSGYASAGMVYYGGAMQQDYHLCSDGTSIRKSAAAGQAAGQNMVVYGQGTNQSRGTWLVAVQKGEPFLVVRDGPEQGFKLEYEGDTFLLDSRPYTITASELCK
jgi:hypothetical protein